MTSIRPTIAVARAKRRDGCLDGGRVAKELLAVDAHLARRTAAAFAGRFSDSGSRGSSPFPGVYTQWARGEPSPTPLRVSPGFAPGSLAGETHRTTQVVNRPTHP